LDPLIKSQLLQWRISVEQILRRADIGPFAFMIPSNGLSNAATTAPVSPRKPQNKTSQNGAKATDVC